MSFGSSSGTLASAAWMIVAVRSSARRSFRDPLKARPIGERAAETITASGITRLQGAGKLYGGLYGVWRRAELLWKLPGRIAGVTRQTV